MRESAGCVNSRAALANPSAALITADEVADARAVMPSAVRSTRLRYDARSNLSAEARHVPRVRRSYPLRRQPIRQKLEGAGPMSGTLHLAQAQSNGGVHGCKRDFPDDEATRVAGIGKSV